MKKRAVGIVFYAAVLFLTGCAKSRIVRNESPNFIGFQFFIFLSVSGHDFQGNGEAALNGERSFHIRVYDNLLNQAFFDFESLADGRNELWVHNEKTVYRKISRKISIFLTRYFYMLFLTLDSQRIQKDAEINSILLENNRIKDIMFQHVERVIKLSVLKRFDGGLPKRIRLEEGGDSVVFDITFFSNQDFSVEEENYSGRELVGEGFFEWIGYFNEER